MTTIREIIENRYFKSYIVEIKNHASVCFYKRDEFLKYFGDYDSKLFIPTTYDNKIKFTFN